MQEKIFEIISRITDISAENLKKDADISGLWDSMKNIEILLSLESELNISFSPEEITKFSTPNNIISIIKSKTNNES